MKNLCMTVSYDGTSYNGFQSQPHGNTIQNKLEAAIFVLTKEEVKIHASGRTDTGVHARNQVFHFHTNSSIPTERWAIALNSRLPDDIAVLDAQEVSMEFHARKSAKRKTYKYTIYYAPYADVFARRTQLFHPKRLNVNAMKAGMEYLVGKHDFSSFCGTKSSAVTHVRTIYDVKVESIKKMITPTCHAEVIDIYITGNGFLYHMVRNIVGTLLFIGEGKWDAAKMHEILCAKDRSKAGAAAPAHGLMLWSVEYDQ